MARNTPKPWRYESVGKCGSTGEEFGNIIAANGVEVAADVYRSDAEAIIAPPEAGAPSNETMASHLRAVADDPTSDLYDNEKMWLREAAGVFEAMDMKYVSAPEPQSKRIQEEK